MQKKKIAIYGLSIETKKYMERKGNDYDVCCLLDSFCTDGTMYGKKIKSLEYVIQERIELIIVVARPGSCKAIAKKIRNVCIENCIELYDVRGNNLLEEKKVVYDFSTVKGYRKNEMISQITQSDVISFDLFDTLIVRNVISQTDVFDIVEATLIEKGIIIEEFANKRLASEKLLSNGRTPKLRDIYDFLIKDISNLEIDIQELVDIEFSVDIGLLEPRCEVVEIIDIAYALGKKVFIVSDSYYTFDQIKEILNRNGIEHFEDVLVSCEYGTSKVDCLFEKLIELSGTKNILHIGDDIYVDIESAKRHGLKCFKIYSAIELLELVGGLNLLKDESSLSDRIRIGLFAAKIFNSPFKFEDDEKRIIISSSHDIGYLLVSAMLLDFTLWFGGIVHNRQIKDILFCARDGYLIQKIYSLVFPKEQTYYFLTSRTAAIRAGVDRVEDIEYVESMKYSGSEAENLHSRFGIDISLYNDANINNSREGLLKYSNLIIETAKKKKENNQKYINQLNIGGDIALFDFVAKGTSQMFIKRLVDNNIIGLYFLQLEPEFMKDKQIDIIPFYSEEERENSAIFDDYYIIETILTAPYPSVSEFDNNGKAIYSEETRSKKDIECIMNVQDGILEYIKKYLSICPKNEVKINKNLDEAFLNLVHNVEILNQEFLSLMVEDPFFNRKTNITDIL